MVAKVIKVKRKWCVFRRGAVCSQLRCRRNWALVQTEEKYGAERTRNTIDIFKNISDILTNSIDISTNLNDILSLLRTEVEFLPSHNSVFSPQVSNLSRGEGVVFRRFAFLFDE
jgi:hypothetical protein